MRGTRRPDVLWRRLLVARVAALAFAIALAALLLSLGGFPAVSILTEAARSAFGSSEGLMDTVIAASPLILTGFAVTLAGRMRLWNIGGEGQFYGGAIATGLVAFNLGSLPAPLLVPLCIAGAMVGGACIAFLPAVLKARLGINEIVTTLMFNFVLILALRWLVNGRWRDPQVTYPTSSPIPENAQLPTLFGTRIHLGFVLAVLVTVVVGVILTRTRWGFEIRVIGASPRAAAYAGIPIARNIVFVLCLSGAAAGLAGLGEAAGVAHHVDPNLSIGFGYTGIVVAMLGGLRAGGTLVAGLLFGGLQVAGYSFQTSGVPYSLVTIIQASVLVAVIVGEVLARNPIAFPRDRIPFLGSRVRESEGA